MKTIELDRALSQIQQLLEIAATGQEIMITQNNQPMVKLVCPYPSSSHQRPPLFGSDKDIIAITDDFDEPLEEFEV